MLECLLIPGISYHGGTVHIQHSPTGRFKVPIEFLHRGPYFFYCTFYKVMTHSILNSMLKYVFRDKLKNSSIQKYCLV